VPRTALAASVHRALRIARLCEVRRLSTGDGLAAVREWEQASASGTTRREWLKLVGSAGVAGAVASIASPIGRLHAAGSSAVADTPLFKSTTTTAKSMQMAQRYGTSSGSVGFKKSKKKKAKKK